jgi:hypothetical protein
LIATNYAGQYQAGGYSGGPEGDEATEIITVAGTNLLMAGYSEIDTALNFVSQGLNLVIDISTGATFGDILIGNRRRPGDHCRPRPRQPGFPVDCYTT